MEDLVSQVSYVAQHVDVVVFDFDETLTRQHTGGRVTNPEQLTPEYIRQNLAHPEFLRALLPALHAAGVRLCIATFSSDRCDAVSNPRVAWPTHPHFPVAGKRLVKAYLDQLVGPDRPYLQADIDFQCWYPQPLDLPNNKNLHLQLLVEDLIPRERILLIDDDVKGNLIPAERAGYLTASARGGFSLQNWQEVLAQTINIRPISPATPPPPPPPVWPWRSASPIPPPPPYPSLPPYVTPEEFALRQQS